MKLALFDLIEDAVLQLDLNHPTFKYAEQKLVWLFESELSKNEDIFVGINTRIKSDDSLREKIIRNNFYKTCNSGLEVLDNLSDLIGINIECRFITDEPKTLKMIKDMFHKDDFEYSPCKLNENVYLNLKMPQPQLQRNGFTIYRLDGYYMHDNRRINYELQIKSLIHNFWSEVEHQVVYKNNNIVYFDQFMRNILSSLRDNLDVVDNQLQIVYQQIRSESIEGSEIGMSEDGFKMFLAKSINDLYTVKMKESVGIASNFKKCSGILSQYFYVKDFLKQQSTQFKMVEYFEQFNLLKQSPIDFKESICLESAFEHYCPFIDTLGKYWESVMNDDFEWHSFFIILFSVETGNNIQDFTSFVNVIRDLIVTPSWYDSKFARYANDAVNVRRHFLQLLGEEMAEYGKINMIFEDVVYNTMVAFHNIIEEIDQRYYIYEYFNHNIDKIDDSFRRVIKTALNAKN